MSTLTAPSPTSAPAAPSPTSDRRRRRGVALAITSAVAVVAAAVGVIVTVGRVPLPPMPSLAAAPDPDIPGTVAFLRADGDRSCLTLVAAGGGELLDLRCGRWHADALAWTTDGRLAVSSWDVPSPIGEQTRAVTVIDPVTGDEWGWAEIGSRDWAADRLVREDGARLVVTPPRDGTVSLRVRHADGTGTELVRLEGPRDYGLASAQWSPDGAWVLAVDTRGRMFLLAADGDPGPRLLAEVGRRDTLWVLPAWSIDDVAAQRVEVGVLAVGDDVRSP